MFIFVYSLGGQVLAFLLSTRLWYASLTNAMLGNPMPIYGQKCCIHLLAKVQRLHIMERQTFTGLAAMATEVRMRRAMGIQLCSSVGSVVVYPRVEYYAS